MNIILIEYDGQKEWSAISVGKKIFIAELVRDGLSVYPALDKHGFVHEPHVIKKRKAHVVLPHVHIYISNLRSFVMGTYHGLDEIHLQQYLDEFCYRFNRRRHYHELFDRLLLACLEKEEMPFSALTT